MTTARTCPRCGFAIGGFPALSRWDNETEVCSTCGGNEAMIQYVMRNSAEACAPADRVSREVAESVHPVLGVVKWVSTDKEKMSTGEMQEQYEVDDGETIR